MTSTLGRLTAAGAMAMAMACAPQQASTRSEPETRPEPAGRTNTLLLTEKDISDTGQPNAYRVIQTARPQWLRVRPMGSSRGGYERIQVYVQGSRFGTVDQLEQIMATSIKEMRFLEARDATTRFVTGHGSGAIMITLR